MQGFISYSHKDYGDFKLLQTHLRQITFSAGFHFCCDQRIPAGYDWHARILNEIGKSTVFLVLASPNYFAAKYVIEYELPAIRNSQRIDDALVMPVILEQCDWEALLRVPQAEPVADKRRVKPIKFWERKGDGFNAVRDQIASALKHKFKLATVPLIASGLPAMSWTEKGLADFRNELRRLGMISSIHRALPDLQCRKATSRLR
jgi:hypothetical protein